MMASSLFSARNPGESCHSIFQAGSGLWKLSPCFWILNPAPHKGTETAVRALLVTQHSKIMGRSFKAYILF